MSAGLASFLKAVCGAALRMTNRGFEKAHALEEIMAAIWFGKAGMLVTIIGEPTAIGQVLPAAVGMIPSSSMRGDAQLGMFRVQE